jgi:lipopolysaccharide transport system ATP-binding protein
MYSKDCSSSNGVMSEVAISLTNVSKSYKRYSRPVDRLKEILLPSRSRAEVFWALQDVNLEIAQGQTLGIVGQNGSGKSTLLQIIAGTLTPTTGEVRVRGRVSALLELGSGFNPEFTGRQNVFFNGQILGLSKREITEKFDRIAAFADIGDFLDRPLKTYSSGMAVRLAFAVAAHIDPKILIVDEALAVGDAKFQVRCMKKIRQLQAEGVTLLLVSHDLSSIKFLCDRAILLDRGILLEQGTPKYVIDRYIAILSTEKNLDSIQLKSADNSVDNLSLTPHPNHYELNRHGNGSVIINSAKIVDLLNNDLKGKVQTGSLFRIMVELVVHKVIDDCVVGFAIRTLTGIVVYGSNTNLLATQFPQIEKGQKLNICFDIPCYLNKGIYGLSIATHSGSGISYDWIDDVTILEVINSNACDGLLDLEATATVVEVEYKGLHPQ